MSTIIGNMAQFVVVTKLLGGNLGFINMYVPNDTTQRTQLWRELITSFDLIVNGFYQVTLTL